MVVVKSVTAKHILDSRKEKTIFISIKTNVGKQARPMENQEGSMRHSHIENPLRRILKRLTNSAIIFQMRL